MSEPALSDNPLTLTGWYAQPLDREQASACVAESHHHCQQAYRSGQECVEGRLRELIGRFWLGKPVHGLYCSLRAVAAERRQGALIELVYGQLLTACKWTGGRERLASGFAWAAPLLDGPAYLTLRRRHALLARLPEHTHPAPPRSLDGLLREAGIIARLEGPSEGAVASPRDTVG